MVVSIAMIYYSERIQSKKQRKKAHRVKSKETKYKLRILFQWSHTGNVLKSSSNKL